jgi:predicted RecA/RadA family phage recombinase
MKNYFQKGAHLDVIAPVNVQAGDLVFVGAIFGVAAIDALAGQTVILTTGEVFELPKVAAEALAIGDRVYFDAVDRLVTGDDAEGANALIGVAVQAAPNPSSTATVRLNSSF